LRPRLALAALATAASLPFLLPFANEPISSFHGEWWAAVLGLAAASLLLFRPASVVAVPRSVLLPLGLATVVTVHVLAGHAAQGPLALLAAAYLLWAALLMVVGRTLWIAVGPGRFSTVLAWALLAAALLDALAAALQAGGVQADGLLLSATGPRLHGNVGQANQLADLLALGAASAGWLAATRRAPLAAAVALALPLGAAMALTGSRAAWGYLAALLVLAMLSRESLGTPGVRRLMAVLLASLAGLVAVALIPPAGPAPSQGATATAGTGVAVLGRSGEERPGIWRAAGWMLAESPLAGAGYGRFAERFFEHTGALDAPTAAVMTHNAHNLPLHVGAELGLPGLAVLGLGLALWWRGRRSEAATPERWWPLAVLTVIGLHSLVEYPLWYAHFLGLASAAFGALDGARLESVSPRAGRPIAWASLALGWFVSATLAQDYRFLEGFLARREPSEVSSPASAQDLARLQGIQRSSLLGHYAELGFCRAASLESDRIDDARVLCAAVMRAAPLPDVVYRVAMLDALAGRQSEARGLWARAKAAYPGAEARALREARGSNRPSLSALADELESKGVQR
jgi:O-antigen ligase